MTGVIMNNIGEGERLAARRRRLFWLSIGVLGIAGAIVGLATGYVAAHQEVAPGEIWSSLPKPLAVSIIAISFGLFVFGCWRFYKAIDEVELVDNLWGSTASYYVYATLFPLWWALNKADVVGEPDDWAIFFAALGGGGIAYVWRKWRGR